MAKMPWFRLYAEFAFDPKIQALDEVTQRRYVMLMCLMCNGDLEDVTERDVTVTDTIVTAALRVTVSDASVTKEALRQMGLIDEYWRPTSWEKRQYKQDVKDPTGAERQRRYRERKRNGSVTVVSRPDTDTDTEERETRAREPRAPDRLRVYPPDDFEPVVATQAAIQGQFGAESLRLLVEHFKSVEFAEPADWQRRFKAFALENGPKMAARGEKRSSAVPANGRPML